MTRDIQHRPPAQLSLSQRATPHAAYTARAKAGPTSRETDTHWRVHHDIVDKAGKVTLRYQGNLYKIGIGRTPITLLVADRDIRIITTATGELLRTLTPDPTRTYQPQPKT